MNNVTKVLRCKKGNKYKKINKIRNFFIKVLRNKKYYINKKYVIGVQKYD